MTPVRKLCFEFSPGVKGTSAPCVTACGSVRVRSEKRSSASVESSAGIIMALFFCMSSYFSIHHVRWRFADSYPFLHRGIEPLKNLCVLVHHCADFFDVHVLEFLVFFHPSECGCQTFQTFSMLAQ